MVTTTANVASTPGPFIMIRRPMSGTIFDVDKLIGKSKKRKKTPIEIGMISVDGGSISNSKFVLESMELSEAQEFLTTDKVERFRKDFLVLMRNTKKLKDLEDLRENEIWRKAVVKWGNSFEEALVKVKTEIENRVNAQSRGGDFVNKDDAKYLLNTMSDAWAFSSDMRSPPGEPLARYRDQNNRDIAQGRERGWWTDDRILGRFLDDLKVWERRTRERSRKAWKWLKDMAEWSQRTGISSGGGRAIPIGSSPSSLSLAGFDVQLKDHSDSDFNDKMIRQFELGLQWYKKRTSKVYPEMLRMTMPFVLDFRGGRGSSAASYEHDHINVNFWGATGKPSDIGKTIAHEMGHRMWNTLSSAAQKRWSAFIEGSSGPLDLRDVVKKWLGKEKDFRRRDPVGYLRFETLLYDPRYSHLDIFSLKSAEEHLARGGTPTFNVTLKPVTGYGGKNAEEAFCEALGLLVSFGPRTVLPEIRHMLTSIVPRLRTEDEGLAGGDEMLLEGRQTLEKRQEDDERPWGALSRFVLESMELSEQRNVLGKKWIAGSKKWWKKIVAESKKFDNASGEKAGKEAIAYLNGVRKSLNDLKEDLWLLKGLWPNMVVGDEKSDRGLKVSDPSIKAAWDLENADDLICRQVSDLEHVMEAAFDPNSMAYKSRPDARDGRLVWGKNRDKDMLDSTIENVSGTMARVDKIVSGKMYRRLSTYVSKRGIRGVKGTDAETEFRVGKVKVVVDYANGKYNVDALAGRKQFTRDPIEHKLLVKALTSAQSLLNKAGFGKAWYGRIEVQPRGKASEYTSPRDGRKYKPDATWAWSDFITLYMSHWTAAGMMEVVIHELGHRWYYKFMSQGDRARFDSWFNEVKPVSSYGGTNSAEDFAEVFAHYVVGKKLSRDQRERFKEFALLRGKIKRHEDDGRPEGLLSRFIGE